MRGLTQQIFNNIDGYEVADLTNSPKYPEKPDETNAIPDINIVDKGGVKNSPSFGERIFGFFKAPADGDYIFKICKKVLLSNTGRFNECYLDLGVWH